jgi:hypothetical protein
MTTRLPWPFMLTVEHSGSNRRFAEILAENVVMHSPVLIKSIIGRESVAITISNSSRSRDNPGKYVFEGKLDARKTLLRWQGMVEGRFRRSKFFANDSMH